MRRKRISKRTRMGMNNTGFERIQWAINAILAIILVILVFPTFIVRGCSAPREEKPEAPIVEKKPVKKAHGLDIEIKLYNHYSKKIETLPLEEYLMGVVSAEMPVNFEIEALKAQAVAARTFVVRQLKSMGGSGCSRHKGADVCSQFDSCQAWEPSENQKKKWGSKYEANIKKIEEAVQSTWGEVVVYGDKPIQAFFHSTSGGMTENVEEVFSQKLPYLRAVSSPGEEDAPRFHGQKSFTAKSFINTFRKSYPKAKLSANRLEKDVSILSRSESGRVKTMRIGGVTVKGTDVRKIFGLDSTNFKVSFGGGKVTFNTTGYGHGVGMSQIGANTMAKDGRNYNEILEYYYTGVEIVSRENLKK